MQLNLVIYSILIGNLYECFYSLYKFILLEPQLFYTPLTITESILHFFDLLLRLISKFCFYLAFYFLIRHSFKTPEKLEKKLKEKHNFFEEEDIRSSAQSCRRLHESSLSS